jgi:hypothetical protein
MNIELNMCVANASLSADPVVTFLERMRKAAYSTAPNPIRAALKKVNPDHVEDLNFIVLGAPSLTTKDPIGFAVEDPVDNTVVTSYLIDRVAHGSPLGRVTSVRADDAKLANVPLSYQHSVVLMRMPMDAL